MGELLAIRSGSLLIVVASCAFSIKCVGTVRRACIHTVSTHFVNYLFQCTREVCRVPGDDDVIDKSRSADSAQVVLRDDVELVVVDTDACCTRGKPWRDGASGRGGLSVCYLT